MTAPQQQERRASQRRRLPPMYTAVRARCTIDGRRGPSLKGHVYDISEGGARIELDEALRPGQPVSVDLDLPGQPGVRAAGSIVWVCDETDDPGPRRMALRFLDFPRPVDRRRLIRYLRGDRSAA